MSKIIPVLVTLFSVSVVLSSGESLREQYQEHMKMVKDVHLPCRLAQPRVFYLEELVDREEWKRRYESYVIRDHIQPLWTILHRCDSSGCCVNKEMRCLPTIVEDVKLTFRNTTTKLQYFQIPVKNHTGCACLSTDNTGKKNIK